MFFSKGAGPSPTLTSSPRPALEPPARKPNAPNAGAPAHRPRPPTCTRRTCPPAGPSSWSGRTSSPGGARAQRGRWKVTRVQGPMRGGVEKKMTRGFEHCCWPSSLGRWPASRTTSPPRHPKRPPEAPLRLRPCPCPCPCPRPFRGIPAPPAAHRAQRGGHEEDGALPLQRRQLAWGGMAAGGCLIGVGARLEGTCPVGHGRAEAPRARQAQQGAPNKWRHPQARAKGNQTRVSPLSPAPPRPSPPPPRALNPPPTRQLQRPHLD